MPPQVQREEVKANQTFENPLDSLLAKSVTTTITVQPTEETILERNIEVVIKHSKKFFRKPKSQTEIRVCRYCGSSTCHNARNPLRSVPLKDYRP